MKNIGMWVIFLSILLGCSACSLSSGSNTKDDSLIKEEIVELETESAEIISGNTLKLNQNRNEPFYGVWCGGSKSKSAAENMVSKLRDLGFEARVFDSSDWENLNFEKFYVVTAGICDTEQGAQQLLSVIKRNGYPDAYVKYTGCMRDVSKNQK